jgi:uncharacterized membrane protein/competence protein ComGC
MEETQKPHRKTSPWRWVLLGAAILLTAIWLFLTPEGLLGKADAVGYAVCHRIDIRSFHINGRQFPLCARCSGMFLGAMLGLIYQVVQGKKGKMPPVAIQVMFGVLALIWALDGANSFTMLIPGVSSVYVTQNWTRLVTGTGMGLTISAFLLPSFIQTMFKDWQDESGFGNWKQLVGVLLAAVILDVLLLLEIPWILIPLALLGSAGVVVLLVMVYSMVLVMIFKKENQFSGFRELWVPLVSGYVIALTQIGLIDLLRYLWTGTWAGFVI